MSVGWTPLQSASIRNLASLGPGGGGSVFAAAFHNTDPNIILLGQDVGGVYKSTDGGLTWYHVNGRGLAPPDFGEDVYLVDELVAHPTNNDRFFACTGSGLFRSDDVGESWKLVIPASGSNPPEISISWIVFSPLNPDLGLVGTGGWHLPDPGSGLYRTTDGGTTFAQIESVGLPANTTITSIAFDPDDGTVYASTTSGLFFSSDNGDSFSQVGFAFRHDQGQWVGIAGSGAQKMIWYVLYTLGEDGDPASRSAGIYRSPDGVNWTEITGEPAVNDPESNELIRAQGARIHPNDPSILFLNLRTDGAQGGLYRYDGVWTNLTAGFVDATWQAGSGFVEIAPEGLEIFSSDPNLMISCNELAVLKTVDGGATWNQVTTQKVGEDRWTGKGAEVIIGYDLAASAGILYAAFEDVGFWRSDDRGASWKQLLWPGAAPDTIRPDGASEVQVHPFDGDRFYVALGSFSINLREDVRSEIQKSTDGGSTTSDVTPPAPAGFLGRPTLAVVWGDTPEQDILYAAFHGDTIYKSTDGGATWTEVSNGIPAEDRQVIFRIAVDPLDPNIVYVGLFTFFGDFTSQGGLYRSIDGGASWTRLENYPYQDVVAIRFAGSPQRLFVGGWTQGAGGLRVSNDGTTFTEVLNQPFVTDLMDVPGSPGSLYAVSSATFVRGNNQNAGLYQSSDNGASWTRLEGDLNHSRVWDMVAFPDQPDVLYLATDGDGILAMEVDDLKRHFAQFSDGGGIASTLLLVNPSSTQAATGTVEIFSDQGNPLSVDINGTVEAGEFSFNLPSGGVRFFATDGVGDPVATGSMEAEADVGLGGTILFSGSLGVAGVGAVRPAASFLVPVESNSASGVSTGVALANPTPNSIEVNLKLRDGDGQSVGGGEVTVPLGARGQVARFPEQLFAGSGADFNSFRGNLEVVSPVPINGMAVRVSPGQFATLPVTSTGFGRRRLHFAQFGEGQGTTSTLILVNPSATVSAKGVVRLFDSGGKPLSVDINATVVAGEFPFDIPARGVGFFATDGVGESLLTGSVEVESDLFLGGTIVFSGSSGVAGVGAVEPASSFLVPLELDSGSGVLTGVALANPSPGGIQFTALLRDSNGQLVDNGTATISLAGRGQLARFPAEIFPEAAVDFNQFSGTMEVNSVVPLAGMAIRVSPGEFATLPVIP